MHFEVENFDMIAIACVPQYFLEHQEEKWAASRKRFENQNDQTHPILLWSHLQAGLRCYSTNPICNMNYSLSV
jgi:hypothetical protein